MDFLDGLKALGQTVAQFAPELGKVLPLPGGEILGRIIAKKFGGDVSRPDDLINAISQDPQASLKLVEIQTNYDLEINKIDLQYFIEETRDKQSARDRQVKIVQAGKTDWVPTILAMGMLVIYAFVQHWVINHPGGQDDVISARVQDIMVIIITFYFGTSAGSRAKDATIQAYTKVFGQKSQ